MFSEDPDASELAAAAPLLKYVPSCWSIACVRLANAVCAELRFPLCSAWLSEESAAPIVSWFDDPESCESCAASA